MLWPIAVALAAAVVLGATSMVLGTDDPFAACRVAEPIVTAGNGLPQTAGRLRGQATLRILAIGSSSTSGVGASAPELAYPARLQAELSRRIFPVAVEVVNAGMPGEMAPAVERRLEQLLGEARPDLVIWQVGTNAALRKEPETEFRAVLDRGIAAVRGTGADLILLDSQFYPTMEDRERYARFVAIVGAATHDHGVPWFSRYALMRAWDARSPGELRGRLADDGFHMNEAGYACIAGLLADVILQLAN